MLKQPPSAKRYLIAGTAAGVSLGISLVSGFMILVMFAFWWESHGDTSIFYKHPLLLQIPLLVTLIICVAATAYRRLKGLAFSLLEAGSYITLPLIALTVYFIFSGAFGQQPKWL